ncbi:MAG: hypothetical protein AMXMBFR84_43500 [Candidatus Hydrogenedentota bacterium]
MGLRINNDAPALQATRQLGQTTRNLLRGLEQQASLQRINRAADDAAGLAISENFRSQIRQLETEIGSLQTGVNYLQTAEGGLDVQTEGLQRVRELAVQASNGTLTDDQRAALNEEAQQILQQFDETAANTEFNGTNPLDGSQPTVNIGTESGIQIAVQESTTNALGLNGLDISTAAGANNALNQVDNALNQISQNRSAIGAQQNRLERGIEQRQIESLNSQDAESRIRGLDIARSFIEQSRNQILQQTGLSALIQSRVSNQNAARLLGG